MKKTICVPAEHRHFEGHFPGFPLFPGVGQISLVLQTLEEIFGEKVRCLGIRRTKFRTILKPDMTVTIAITEISSGHVRFTIKDGEAIYSSGELSFVRVAPLN